MLRKFEILKSALVFANVNIYVTLERVSVKKINFFIFLMICNKFHDFIII